MSFNKTLIREKLYLVLLCSYAFLLPTLNNLTTPIIIALFLTSIVDINSLKSFYREHKRNFIVLGFPLIFILSALSLLYTENFKVGIDHLFKSSPFLLFPIALHKVNLLKSKELNLIIRLFVIGCVATVLYSFSYVIYDIIEGSYKEIHSPDNYMKYYLNRITYHDLVSKNRVDHSVYFAAYILTALVAIRTNKALFSNYTNKLITSLLLITFVLMTSIIISISALVVFVGFHHINKKASIIHQNHFFSRKTMFINIGWLFLIFYLIIWKVKPHAEFIYLFNNLKFNFIIIFGVVFGLLAVQLAVKFSAFINLKYLFIAIFSCFLTYTILLVQFQNDTDSLQLSNFTARLSNSYASAITIKNNFFIGVGVGDVQNHLSEIYDVIKFENTTYNEHNQYYRFWLGSGITTFLLYAFWLFKLIDVAFKDKKLLLLCVSLTLFLFSFTESVFARQMGISYFMFFTYFFYYSDLSKTNIQT